MTRLTRREFLRTSGTGAGLGLLAAAGVAGCAPTIKGDFAPKAGRRVVVIGGGWGGAVAVIVAVMLGWAALATWNEASGKLSLLS